MEEIEKIQIKASQKIILMANKIEDLFVENMRLKWIPVQRQEVDEKFHTKFLYR